MDLSQRAVTELFNEGLDEAKFRAVLSRVSKILKSGDEAKRPLYEIESQIRAALLSVQQEWDRSRPPCLARVELLKRVTGKVNERGVVVQWSPENEYWVLSFRRVAR